MPVSSLFFSKCLCLFPVISVTSSLSVTSVECCAIAAFLWRLRAVCVPLCNRRAPGNVPECLSLYGSLLLHSDWGGPLCKSKLLVTIF